MARILAGAPERSNGALTIVTVAIEAGVPRNALTLRRSKIGVTWPELGLRGVVILVDHSRDDGSSAYRSQADHITNRLRLDVRGPLAPGLQAPHQPVEQRQQHLEMVPASAVTRQRNASSPRETGFPSGTGPALLRLFELYDVKPRQRAAADLHETSGVMQSAEVDGRESHRVGKR